MCKKYLLAAIISFALISCKNKKVPLNENTAADINDFLEAFPVVTVPYQITDEVLWQEQKDSLFVNYNTFIHFIPDSVITKHFPKSVKPKIYLQAEVRNGKNEFYLFFNAITSAKKITYLACLTKEKKFASAKVLFAISDDDNISNLAAIDNKFNIAITRRHKNAEGEMLFKKDTYFFNDAGTFTLILTESNETNANSLAIINPIDTLSHKHKFAGDYVENKRNFISVRDGKDATRFLFFVHFEKDNGECKGELKGTAKFISPNIAQYHSNSNPCVVQFSFNNNAVYMKEISACGNYRDIKCFFDGSYKKKKEEKKKPAKKQTNPATHK
jgi:hypothetical protein